MANSPLAVVNDKLDEDRVRDFHHIWHPCTQMKDHEVTPPLLIDRAEGIYLYDREGRRYMDVISSWWVNLLGHQHPGINQAIRDQLDRMAHVMFAGVTHTPAIDLAEKLVKASSPGLAKVFFSDNGSTSVEVALKMSLQYWLQTGQPRKTKFIYLKGGYHGETLGALSVCGMKLFRDKFETVLPQNIEVEGPDCLRCPLGLQRESCQAECFEPMAKALEKHHDTVAGVIIEPLVQGAAGMKMYPPVYLKKLEDACKASNIHTIYDEVAVGFGRTGSLFVSEHHGMSPDFLCLSKGITSGYLPLAATLTTDEVYQAFYDDYGSFKLFIHSHSYSANPLACAAANATLDRLTAPGFMDSLQPKMDALRQQGETLRELPWCGEFRQTGMIAAVELVKNRDTFEPFPVEQRVGHQIFLEGLKREVVLRPLGNVVYFIPPLIIDPDQIQSMITAAYESISTVLKGI